MTSYERLAFERPRRTHAKGPGRRSRCPNPNPTTAIWGQQCGGIHYSYRSWEWKGHASGRVERTESVRSLLPGVEPAEDANDGLGVADLAGFDGCEGLGGGADLDFDVLVFVCVEGGILEVRADEEVDVLSGIAGRDVEAAERFDLAGEAVYLFLEFAGYSRDGLFVGLQSACGQFKEAPAGGVTVLGHKQQVAVGVDGDHADGPGVAEDFALCDDASVHLNGVEGHIEKAAVVDGLGGEQARVGHGGIVDCRIVDCRLTVKCSRSNFNEMVLRPCRGGNEVDWIVERTRHAPNGTVASLVPAGYEAYTQVLHAIHPDPGVPALSATDFGGSVSESRGKADEILASLGAGLPEGVIRSRARSGGSIGHREGTRVRWSDLARHLGGQLSVPASFERDLWDLLDGDWPDQLDGPTEGSLTVDEAQSLVAVLDPFSQGEVTFWYTWANTENYDGRCDVGRVSDLLEFFASDEVFASPEYWWPDDRSWAAHTNIDLAYTLVAGSSSLFNELLRHPALECIELAEDSRLWPAWK